MNVKVKIIIVILIVILLAGAGWLFWKSSKPNQNSAASILQNSTNPQNAAINSAAVIILSASKNKVKVGEDFTVSINISSRRPSDGTDMIILYDPNLLSVLNDTSAKPVAVRSLYQEYPVNSDDQKGKITVSGINLQTGNKISSGLFGTITFKAKAKGKTTIALDFIKGSTKSSNIIESGTAKNILQAVQNTEVTAGD